MGVYDRDYVFKQRGAGRPGGVSVTTWLVVINVVVFVLDMMTTPRGVVFGPFQVYGHFSTAKLLGGLEVWRLLTFQFLHGGMLHIVFNMIGLWSFGRMVEEYLGSYKYLAFYLVSGICGGLMYLGLNGLGWFSHKYLGWDQVPGLLFHDPRVPLVGASAGVFGVIMAAAYIAPNLPVQLLFPPIPMRLKVMAYAFVTLALLTVVFGGHNAGGEAAHIGGAIAGFFFIRNSHLLRDFFDVFSDSRKERRREEKAARTGAWTQKVEQENRLQAEVDRILAKVHAQGIQALTEDEKATLRKATERRMTGT